MSLKEALSSGLITPQTVVKVDSRTGHVRVVDTSSLDVIQAIIDSKDQLDWVNDLEKELTQQHKSVKPEIAEIDRYLHEDKVRKHN